MKRLKVPYIVIILFGFTSEAIAYNNLNTYKIALQDVHVIADALNTVGGLPAKKLNKQQIWANICPILDTPFKKGKVLLQSTNINSNQLQEAAILEYNEAKVNLAYALVLKYYLLNGHQLVNIPSSDEINIVAHIHRPESNINHAKLLTKMIDDILPNNDIVTTYSSSGGVGRVLYEMYSRELNINLQIRKGYLLNDLGNYNHANIVISFSLASGLNNDYNVGELMLPYEFIPTSLESMQIFMDQRYIQKNHLIENLEQIIALQTPSLISVINSKYRSTNEKKFKLRAKTLSKKDFKIGSLLQVDKPLTTKILSKRIRIMGK